MKRFLVALVVGAVLVGAGAPMATAERSWRWDECRFRNYSGGPSFNATEIEMTVRCGVWHWEVSGGASKALAVMRCESGGGQFATSPGGHQGLFQFAPSTFLGTYNRWEAQWERWNVRRNAYNARANILLAMKKAHHDGWGAWSCA